MYVVRFQVHRKFFQQASDALLAWQFCDLAYKSFVRWFGGVDGQPIYIPLHPVLSWMYFYTYDETQSKFAGSHAASASLSMEKPTVEDRETAARILPDLTRTIPQNGCNTAEEVAFALAVVRRSVALCFCTYYARFLEPDSPLCEMFSEHFTTFMPIRAPDEASTQALNWFLLVARPPWGYLQRLGATSDLTALEQMCKEKAATALSAYKKQLIGSDPAPHHKDNCHVKEPIYYSSFHFIFHYPNITPI